MAKIAAATLGVERDEVSKWVSGYRIEDMEQMSESVSVCTAASRDVSGA